MSRKVYKLVYTIVYKKNCKFLMLQLNECRPSGIFLTSQK